MHRKNSIKKLLKCTMHQWLMPVILSTQEAEIMKIMVQS
jgi:hypothetical protein